MTEQNQGYSFTATILQLEKGQQMAYKNKPGTYTGTVLVYKTFSGKENTKVFADALLSKNGKLRGALASVNVGDRIKITVNAEKNIVDLAKVTAENQYQGHRQMQQGANETINPAAFGMAWNNAYAEHLKSLKDGASVGTISLLKVRMRAIEIYEASQDAKKELEAKQKVKAMPAVTENTVPWNSQVDDIDI